MGVSLTCGNCGYWKMESYCLGAPAKGKCRNMTGDTYLTEMTAMDSCDLWGPEGGKGKRDFVPSAPPKLPCGGVA